MESTLPKTLGVLLAGGQARRMGGGDKCLRLLEGKPLLQHVIDRMGPQVDRLILNANGDPARFDKFGLQVVPDAIEGFAGPLAGVLAGMTWTTEHAPEFIWILTVATDAPFLPTDLVRSMHAAVSREEADMACVASSGRHHPVIGLWPVRLRQELDRAMREEDIRKVDRWTARYHLAVADFDGRQPDPFFNANRPEDFEKAEEFFQSG